MNESIIIKAIDGFPLKAYHFRPKAKIKACILLCPGLGIPKKHYYKYCEYLATQGYVTVVFDYRGIDKNDDRLGYQINLRNWGLKDIPGLLKWFTAHYAGKDIYYFGHSIGGQIAGMIPNYHLIKRFIFFCSTTGHWTDFGFPMNMIALFMFHVHIPITTKLFNYLPPSLTYRGVRIAKGVAEEWAQWSRQKQYIAAFLDNTIPINNYNNITKQIDWIKFSDDAIASTKAIDNMMAYYTNAAINLHSFDPQTMGIGRIGHAGFFHPKAGKELWHFPLEIIESV